MPVVTANTNVVGQINYQTGLTSKGAPIVRVRKYSGMKENSNKDDIYEVLSGIASLCSLPLVSIRLINDSELINM
jgi:hypothetical protein